MVFGVDVVHDCFVGIAWHPGEGEERGLSDIAEVQVGYFFGVWAMRIGVEAETAECSTYQAAPDEDFAPIAELE